MGLCREWAIEALLRLSEPPPALGSPSTTTASALRSKPSLSPCSFRMGFFLAAHQGDLLTTVICPQPVPPTVPRTVMVVSFRNDSNCMEWLWKQYGLYCPFPLMSHTVAHLYKSPHDPHYFANVLPGWLLFSSYHCHQPSSPRHILPGLKQFLPTSSVVRLQFVLRTTVRLILHCQSD